MDPSSSSSSQSKTKEKGASSRSGKIAKKLFGRLRHSKSKSKSKQQESDSKPEYVEPTPTPPPHSQVEPSGQYSELQPQYGHNSGSGYDEYGPQYGLSSGYGPWCGSSSSGSGSQHGTGPQNEYSPIDQHETIQEFRFASGYTEDGKPAYAPQYFSDENPNGCYIM